MKTLFAIAAMLLLSASCAAAKPTRECMSREQASKANPGEHLRYRQVDGRRCWYAGKTPPKSHFKSEFVTPRAPNGGQPTAARTTASTGLAPLRVQSTGTASAPLAARDPFYQAMLEDAVLALTGLSEEEHTRRSFEAMWARAMQDVRGP